MPTYLCNGSVCRMRSRRSFYFFKVPMLFTISLSRIIRARNAGEARDLFWNEHFRPRIKGFKWPGRHFEVRELTPEERDACREEVVPV
jgi:hypothetical protein